MAQDIDMFSDPGEGHFFRSAFVNNHQIPRQMAIMITLQIIRQGMLAILIWQGIVFCEKISKMLPVIGRQAAPNGSG